jgi:hypothetical protein
MLQEGIAVPREVMKFDGWRNAITSIKQDNGI